MISTYVEDSPYKLEFGYLDHKTTDEEIRQVLEIVGELKALYINRGDRKGVFNYIF